MTLSSVPSDRIAFWERLGRRLPLRRRMVAINNRLASAGEPLGTLIFPVGAICVLARQNHYDPQPLASSMVGWEGMLGCPGLLGVDRWQHEAIVVAGGDIVEVAAGHLIAAAEADAGLRALLFRYLHNHTLQLAQNTIANLGHSLERRLARWLTMFHDRSPGDELRLTHETLGMLLNVRRASVTDALHILEGEQLVRCTRGLVAVRDRAGLQRAAGNSYGFAEDDYNAAIGPFGKGSASEQAEREPARQSAGG